MLAGGPWPVEPVLPFPSPLHIPYLPDDLIQLTAMCWMREFIQLAGRVMLPYSSGILTAVLPCLSYDDRKKSILVNQSCSHSIPATATHREVPVPVPVSCPWGAGPGKVLPPSANTHTGPLDVRGLAVAGLGQLWWGCSGFSVADTCPCVGPHVPYTAFTQTSRRWQTCATRA